MQEPEEDETLTGMRCTWIVQPGEGSETQFIVKVIHLEKNTSGFSSASLFSEELLQNSHDLPLLVLRAEMNPKARSFYS